MRAPLDANVLISYLRNPAGTSPPVVLVDAVFTGSYRLLITARLLAELCEKTAAKPYSATRITRGQVDRLVAAISVIAETLPEIPEALPNVGRDRKDDYLFAHAVAGQAEFLVSGDKDLLSVGSIGNASIVSPAAFVSILEDADLLP